MAHMLTLDRDGRTERTARRRWAVALMAALSTTGACSKEPAPQEPVVTVQTVTVAPEVIADVVTADALLYPLAQAAIVPKISAPVERFEVNRGERVRKGQVLVVLEHQDLAAAAAQSLGLFEQAQATYAMTQQASVPAEVQKAELDVSTLKEAFDSQQRVYDDRQRLFTQGALPRRDLEIATVALGQAKSQYEIARLHLSAMRGVTRTQTLKAAEAQLASVKGQYEAAVAQLGYATIRSPIDGVVTDRSFYPGEMATAGTPLLTVMDTSATVARAPVPAARAASLKAGDAATLIVPGVIKPVVGTVIIVSPALDPSSTTVQVWVQAPNPDGALKPGTSVRVTVVARTVPDALVVPEVALLTAPDGSHSVMVVDAKGVARTRPVEIGITQGDRVQVTKGLRAGETVVAAGAYGLPDGMHVRVPAPSPATPQTGAKKT